jgi:hypothetical protein
VEGLVDRRLEEVEDDVVEMHHQQTTYVVQEATGK